MVARCVRTTSNGRRDDSLLGTTTTCEKGQPQRAGRAGRVVHTRATQRATLLLCHVMFGDECSAVENRLSAFSFLCPLSFAASKICNKTYQLIPAHNPRALYVFQERIRPPVRTSSPATWKDETGAADLTLTNEVADLMDCV